MNEHLIVVDDDPEIRQLLQRYLEQHGYRVSSAKDGAELRRLIKRHAFDLIILDIMTAGEDSLSLCHWLTEHNSIPIIFLTAMAEETDRIVGLEMGADDYLIKPFNPRELLARVKAVVRRISKPLDDLARAAGQIGAGHQVAPLNSSGPEEIQRLIQAFNLMNECIQRFIQDRTQMLAALSHDLRTTITQLRLRVELMPDSEDRQKMLTSLEEMQLMAEASLDFVRESTSTEKSQKVDIGALIDAVAQDYQDQGQVVDCHIDTQGLLLCRPVSLKRAMRNLIDNALFYGQAAQIQLTQRGNDYCITIADNGPGIGAEDRQRVFEPLTRVHTDRNRQTGGAGLGLAICKQVILSDSRHIELSDHQPTGLLVNIHLPRQH